MIEIWEALKAQSNHMKDTQFYADWVAGYIKKCGWENKNVKTTAKRELDGITYEVHFKALDWHYKATLPPDCKDVPLWLLDVNKVAKNAYKKEMGKVQ